MSGRRCDEGKTRHSSHAAATKVIIAWNAGAARRGKGQQVPIRAYRCSFCRLWHLTSQPQRST